MERGESSLSALCNAASLSPFLQFLYVNECQTFHSFAETKVVSSDFGFRSHRSSIADMADTYSIAVSIEQV